MESGRKWAPRKWAMESGIGPWEVHPKTPDRPKASVSPTKLGQLQGFVPKASAGQGSPEPSQIVERRAKQMSIQVFEVDDRPFLVNRARKAAEFEFTRLPIKQKRSNAAKRFNAAEESLLRQGKQLAKAMGDNTGLGNDSKSRTTLENAVLSENNQRKTQEKETIAKGQTSQDTLSKKEEDLLLLAEKTKQQRLPMITVDTRPPPSTLMQKAETARIPAVNHEQLGHLRPSRDKQLDEMTPNEHPQHGANGTSPKAGPGRSTGLSLPPLGSHKLTSDPSLPESAPTFATARAKDGPLFRLSKRVLQDKFSGIEHPVYDSAYDKAKRKQQEREWQNTKTQHENFLSSYASLQKELLALPIASSTKRHGPKHNYEPTDEQKSGFHVPLRPAELGQRTTRR